MHINGLTAQIQLILLLQCMWLVEKSFVFGNEQKGRKHLTVPADFVHTEFKDYKYKPEDISIWLTAFSIKNNYLFNLFLIISQL